MVQGIHPISALLPIRQEPSWRNQKNNQLLVFVLFLTQTLLSSDTRPLLGRSLSPDHECHPHFPPHYHFWLIIIIKIIIIMIIIIMIKIIIIVLTITMVIITLHRQPGLLWQILVVVRGHLAAQHNNSTTTTVMRKSQHIKCVITYFTHKNIEIVFKSFNMSQTKMFTYPLQVAGDFMWGEQVFWHFKEIAFISPVHSEKKKTWCWFWTPTRFIWVYLFLSWFGKDVYKSLELIPDIGIGIPFLHLKDLAHISYIFPYTPFIYKNSEESGRSTPDDLINSIF